MMATRAIAGFFILAIACGVGFGVASADSSDELARLGAFGFDEATHASTMALASTASDDRATGADAGTSGQQVLATPSPRDINAGLSLVDKRASAADASSDDKARQDAAQAPSKQDGKAELREKSAADAQAPAVVTEDGEPPFEELSAYDLPAIDWSVGKKAFLRQWTQRIDAYLDGTPLQGYGSVFAEAAWENSVDPRWSPAISNTESGNGAHCFLPYNAWGWGADAWNDWDTAIRAHVAGLAAGYGYSLTFEAAQKYCPPNCYHWYNNTLGQMRLM